MTDIEKIAEALIEKCEGMNLREIAKMVDTAAKHTARTHSRNEHGVDFEGAYAGFAVILSAHLIDDILNREKIKTLVS